MTGMYHGLSRLDQLVKVCLQQEGPDKPFASVFGRLRPPNPVFIKNITHKDVIDTLDELSQTMARDDNEDGPVDAGMTFLGQFVDHDITMDATSALGTRIDPATIVNVRSPALDLDCVYGAGPDASPHLYGKDEAEHYLMFGTAHNERDLARTSAEKALIGDPRNDENVIVSQIQGVFIRLHNTLMSKIDDGNDMAEEICECAHGGLEPHVWHDYVHPKLKNFEEVRRFIRLHYQWCVWNEFLPSFVDQACLDRAMATDVFSWNAPVMPVEFSGAAYRFGHATTQAGYKLTADGDQDHLFKFLGFGKRPVASDMDMAMFFEMKDGPSVQKARPVGPGLGRTLLELPFVKDEIGLSDIELTMSLAQSKNLALRNMIRDRYTYQLASGQQVAAFLGEEEVAVPDVLKQAGFTKTPLWFYCLQEAEQHGNGKLTGVGGLIVASVFANLLKRDRTTYLHHHHFEPWKGFGGQPSVLAGMIAYVEEHWSDSNHREALKSG